MTARMVRASSIPLVCAALMGALASACGSSDATDVFGSAGAPPDNGSETPSADQKRYMGAVTVTLPGDLYSTYTAVISDVSEATDITLRTTGLETPDWVTPSAYDNSIFIPEGSSPTITKYTVGADDQLVVEGQVSFASLGVSSVYNGPVPQRTLIAPDKAYFFNDGNQEIIIWDPSTMELTGRVVDLSAVLNEPIADLPGFSPATLPEFGRISGDRLFVPVRWANWDSLPPAMTILPSAGLLVIDITNDSVVRLLVDERLADSIYTVMPDSGDIYLFTGAFGVAFQHLAGTTRPGGALRVRAGEETFDPDFYINLDEAVGNRPASAPVWAGGTSVFLKAYHEDYLPIPSEVQENPLDLISQQGWRYWRVDLEGQTPAQEMAEVPWTSTDGFFYELPEEERLFIGVLASDYGRTTLFEVAPGGFTPSVDVTGVLQTISPLAGAQ